ncbi:MAG: NUDIX hydrolase [Leptospiraceae bacterium]|nr:NUDIX hydrolase [Leptospiraceae bacterium]MDW8305777.1 NUDIX hydrolase [Leptospiraceae bacterium]
MYPRIAVDIIVEQNGKILLVKRKFPPYGWALPGGFVEWGECVEQAALRELQEETGLEGRLLDILYVYSHPKRDSRAHVISVVFVAQACGRVMAQDDAGRADFFPFDRLPSPLCFDHEEIIQDYVRLRCKKERVDPQVKLSLYGQNIPSHRAP